jgi:signal transduction histidine kinase
MRGATSLSPVKATRRLALGLVLAGAVLAIPVGVLVAHTYRQLDTEVFYEHQAAAAEVVKRVNERVYTVLKPESERPFDHYGFYSIPQSALAPESTVNISPLAEPGVETTVPGVIGYFQIDPDGQFRSPVLPEIDLDGVEQQKMSEGELSRRRALRSRLQGLLGAIGERDAVEYAAGRLAPEGRAADPKPADRLAASDKAKVQNAASDEAGASRQIADLKLDEGQYRKREARSLEKDRGLAASKSLPQAPRKEVLSYLEDRPVAREEEARPAAAAPPPARGDAPALQSFGPGAKIERFEGEIYPLEFEVLPNGDFSFYRKVWRDRQRYVQGFVIDGEAFLREVVEEAYSGSALAGHTALVVAYKDRVLRSYGGPPREGATLVLRSALSFPLGAVELVFSSDRLPQATGTALVNGIALFLAVLIPGVLFGVYRLGRAQIELARERSNFVSAVSHELRTPLTSIRMYGEILRAGWVEDEEKKRAYYDFIFFESERLSRLIANVLEIARLSNHGAALALMSYTPDRLLDLLCAKLRSQIEAAGFELEVSRPPAPEDLAIDAEEDAACRVFINLVDNAIKFSRAGPRKAVAIGYRIGPGEVSFFVRDYGPGIARVERRKLFRLFYRAEDELTRTTPGTGIGLALSAELCAKMKAEVDWENKDPGVEFSVRFPSRRAL